MAPLAGSSFPSASSRAANRRQPGKLFGMLLQPGRERRGIGVAGQLGLVPGGARGHVLRPLARKLRKLLV